MRRGSAFGWVAACLVAAGCGVRLEGGDSPNPDGRPADPDAPNDPPDPDAPPPLGAWGRPDLIQGAGGTGGEDDASLSSSALELVFAIADPAANNTKDLYYMSRPSRNAAWSAPVMLAFNVTGVSDETPRFSTDDKTLYFASGRTGGPGNLDIYRVTRPTVGVPQWGSPALVSGVSTAGLDKWFTPCAADNQTYLTILGTDIGEGEIGSEPTVQAELSSPTGTETGPFLSPDCKTVYFSSTRSGQNQIWVSTRTAIGAAWSAPTLVEDFAMLGGAQEDPWLSSDLRIFVFVSNVSGSKDVYISTR